MAHPKHEKSYVNFDKPYETNVIGMRGILYFGIGLFLLIVVTFGLMLFFLDLLEDQALNDDQKRQNPMEMTKEEALPPEPRLQSAPGFGVEDPKKGFVNLELREPQAEYRELKKQWEDTWENGQTVVGADGKKTVVTLPIKDAKAKLIQQRAGDATASKDGDNVLKESRSIVSAASGGRSNSGTIR